MKLRLLNPDATLDGKIIFNFVNPDYPSDVITIIKEVKDYKKATLQAAKIEAKEEAKTIAKAKVESKTKKKKALDALAEAGIIQEEFED